jgi:hypothetical protein
MNQVRSVIYISLIECILYLEYTKKFGSYVSENESGSGSISQRHGSADPDPDPPQNVIDSQHCI